MLPRDEYGLGMETGYVLRAQRISCDDCGNRGIDSAAQTNHDRVEVAFATVIAEPERERGKNLLRYFTLVKFDCGSSNPYRRLAVRPSRNAASCAITFPAEFTAKELPSKTSWSLPPIRLQ
jgi:hypothetical protein